MESPNGLEQFIAERVKSKFRITELAGDASDRKYFRIIADSINYAVSVDKSIKGVNREEFPYLIVYNLFKSNNIDIPGIYDVDYNLGFILMQYLGSCRLLDYCRNFGGNRSIDIYKKAIDVLIKIQSIPKKTGIPFEESFDVSKLNFEFDFFIEHTLINYYNLNRDTGDIADLRDEFYHISEVLFKPELFVLNHRDYHSKNILIFENRPFVIDFQDARMGLPQYDIVSLLRDSYFRLNDSVFETLKEYYYCKAADAGVHNMEREEFDYYFDVMAFQRNIKAAGSFGYLTICKGLTAYKNFIAPALSYLDDYAERRPRLRRALKILRKIIR